LKRCYFEIIFGQIIAIIIPCVLLLFEVLLLFGIIKSKLTKEIIYFIRKV